MSRYFTGQHDGIEYRVEHEPADGEDQGKFEVCINAPPGPMFTATRGGLITRIVSLVNPLNWIFRRKRITTDDQAFDDSVVLYGGDDPGVVASVFQDSRRRAAVKELFGLGFDSVTRGGAYICASRALAFRRAFSSSDVVAKAVPCLAVLAGLSLARPASSIDTHSPGGASDEWVGTTPESAPAFVSATGRSAEQSDRLEAFVKQKDKDPSLAAFLAIFTPFAPFAYWYIGGWRYFVLCVALLVPLIYALASALPHLMQPALMLFWIVMPWKAAVAANLRKKLLDRNVASEPEFRSFQYAVYAMTDVLFGVATALGPALLAAYMMSIRWDSIEKAIALYACSAAILAWFTEVALGFIVFRLLDIAWMSNNPFFEQQRIRWCKTTQISSPGRMESSSVMNYLPSWPEILRATLLTLAAAPLIFFVQVQQAGKFERSEWAVKNLPDGLAQIRDRADRGQADAQFNLGLMYQRGAAVTRDMAEAIKWWHKAAAQGHAMAQHNLGVAYAEGDGVVKDGIEAVKWFQKAADQGEPSAQHSLGLSYMLGNGVARNAAEARNWWRKSADQGNARAQNDLGIAYSRGEGVAKNAAEAVKWWRKAADQGYTAAQVSLGNAYVDGEGVAKNDAEAVKWLRKAADKGDRRAQSMLRDLLPR